MAKVTSKFQVTVPKAIAEQYQIHPGDEIEWVPAGETIRVIPSPRIPTSGDRDNRLHMFDQATLRLEKRVGSSETAAPGEGRGWTREDLYQRGSPR